MTHTRATATATKPLTRGGKPKIKSIFTHVAAVLFAAMISQAGAAQETAAGSGQAATPAAENAAPVGSVKTHAMSLLGQIKYPADFTHFDYVNVDAPKGGKLRLSGIGGFDSLNHLTVSGNYASSIGLIYDTLLTQALDEPATEYGLLAEQIEMAEDFSWVIYTLRAEAKWHDGEPVTPDDVIFSLKAMREGVPLYRYYYQNIVSAEKLDDHRIKFTFDQAGNRELPHITGQIVVIPKHYWEATDAQGKPRDITKTTLEPPLGGGPYKIKEIIPGRNIIYERVPDYWGKDLPVNVGANNFGEIEYIYFKDPTIALEGFFADAFDFRLENNSKLWATQYGNKPAIQDGRVKKELVPSNQTAGMQGFFFNTRRALFKDPRVRQALGLVYNFEWANDNLFYGQYTRLNSYFDNSELASSGLPSADELKLLEPFRDQLPPEVFDKEYRSPVFDSPEAARENYKNALALLADAGWTLNKKGVLVNAQGSPFTFEFLLVSPAFERVVHPYVQDLQRVGIAATIRIVDSAQYENKFETFDYDVVVFSAGQSHSPGNEQRDFWGSAAADRPGSRNVAGIKDPAVDALIEDIIFADSRDDLITATRALDRVLLWSHYVVPHWYLDKDRIAYWNRVKRPDPLPEYSLGMPAIWWSAGAEKSQTAQ